MSRTYVISDLHGRSDVLEAALERIEASPSGGKVVFTGDYVDRGPWSKEVVDRLMAGPTKPGWEWICLKGNHEDMMVGAIRGEYEQGWWIGNGGSHTLSSYPDFEVPQEHVEWMDKLPVCYSDGQRIFVHAGVDETLSLAQQTERDLVWSRVPKQRDYHHPEGYVVHGHTPFEDGPIVLQGRANMDTGAVWTGRLAIAVFDDDVSGAPIEIFTVQKPSLDALSQASPTKQEE
ncbi:serine/threonine protein phosphatase [Mesorhizobium sp. BR1-1-9]|uniref:metallophosphoesterase family protein n=1 Tax=Mesorhizobium sp. BR1-1-9 TaxID=2876646 RepID=UPI001CD0E518|nr:metallophosphoesterase family protein [Mesorhizobium sp. BR1-1-9]MBZ9873099.1 serine/threonine protein phosphatase [Mesorhizobium sp. BR1-1-9]